jgi:UbiD family decarboxylase
MDDLQSFLQTFENRYPDQVWHIREPVPRDYVATGVALQVESLPRPPVLIFEDIEGAGMPIVTNLFASRERIAYAIGTTADKLHEHWVDLSQKLTPPVHVAHGVSQEVCCLGADATAEWLPLMTHFRQDGGRYITSGVVVARDPETGTGNLSYARMQFKGPRRFGISMHSRGHLWDYYRRAEAHGEPLPVAVVIGCHPAFLIGAASRVAMEIDEYDIVDALLGHPLEVVQCKTVDLDVPADAEIVLEGVIEANLREEEGPFGEYTGYATGRSTRNVFTLKAITHRARPYFLDIHPGASKDHLYLGRVQKEVEVMRRLRQTLPYVRAIHYPISGTHYHCYISLAKQKPGDARHAALMLLGLDAYVKLVIVVDDDIDVTNQDEVLWAVATRMQPRADTFVLDDMPCNILDPSSQDGLSSKLAIDATRPLGWEIERCSVPEDAQRRAEEIVRTISGRP